MSLLFIILNGCPLHKRIFRFLDFTSAARLGLVSRYFRFFTKNQIKKTKYTHDLCAMFKPKTEWELQYESRKLRIPLEICYNEFPMDVATVKVKKSKCFQRFGLFKLDHQFSGELNVKIKGGHAVMIGRYVQFISLSVELNPVVPFSFPFLPMGIEELKMRSIERWKKKGDTKIDIHMKRKEAGITRADLVIVDDNPFEEYIRIPIS